MKLSYFYFKKQENKGVLYHVKVIPKYDHDENFSHHQYVFCIQEVELQNDHTALNKAAR